MKDLDEVKKNIRMRNYREWAACAFCFFFFTYSAFVDSSLLSKIFFTEIVLASLFVAFYIFKNSHKELADSSREELLKREVRFLKRVPYWYCTPFFIGLIGVSINSTYLSYHQGSDIFFSILYILSLPIVFAGIVFINKKASQKLTRDLAF